MGSDLAITFKAVPIPPSSNNQYASFMRSGKIWHVPSKELVAFRKSMEYYWLAAENTNLLKFAREALSGHPIEIETLFYFEKSRLLTKKDTMKKLDVSNRLKALHDSFADALLIDDSAFVRCIAEKRVVVGEENEGVEVTLSVCDFVEKKLK